ncbi:MAG: cellobiose phosphorylase, partial [Kofleriaceae bacterium]
MLDVIDWQAFYEQTSVVERILRRDPARIYERMDFGTCDAYRRAVEVLAWDTGHTETAVADLAITLATEVAETDRRGHVGYYLVDEGRALIEQRLHHRPAGLARLRRGLTRWPTVAYLGPLALMTLVPLIVLAGSLAHADMPMVLIVAAVLSAAIPISVVAVEILRRGFARLLPPRMLPKLDFTKGMDADVRTLVVIPTLLGRVEDVSTMLRQLELHYLSNPDPQLQFALLTDEVDAKTSSMDTTLYDQAARELAALNVKHARQGAGPFHLLHRASQWNPAEQRFMGWERKRGKLEELNRLLRGDKTTSYSRHVGDPQGLTAIRFVITLDSDTQLPMGAAQRLVGVLAHPLNQAQLDRVTGRVMAGYTIVQPRIETSPSTTAPTWFARVFAGDVGFDIYTHAVSELYQDLFGAGIYCGKGIYEVDSFTRSMANRVPENAIVSHDLFEGVHGRTALASDVVLYEGYPSSYAAYARRMHRWVRGD